LSTGQKAASVVVMGGGGFIGRHLIEVLAASSDLRPIAASRKRPDGGGIEWRGCDATDRASVEAALAGAAAVVNCVAGDAATMLAATRAICAEAGQRRVVHLSSMAVYGEATGLVKEAHPLTREGNWYTQAKVGCEAAVRELAADWVVLRPGCIHGPGSEPWTARIGRLLRQHRIGDLGAEGDGLCNLVHVTDVAEAIAAALRRPGISGEAFNLGAPDPGTWNEYFVRFARAIGATPVRRVSGRWLRIEGKLLAPALQVAKLAASRVGAGRLAPDPIPRSLLALWRQDIQLDHRKADAMLAFPRTPPDQAIADAAAWFTGLA